MASGGADTLVYVSLRPGTIPGGSSAVVRRVGEAATLTTTIRDGGFDPVPIGAEVGDSVEVIVRNAGGASVFESHLAVAARRPPVVVRTYPPRKKTDVPLNSAIVVVFSEPVADGSLTPASVRLLHGTTLVAGTTRLLQGSAAAVVFIPDRQLDPNSDYRLVVTDAVRDLDGDALAPTATVEFSTGTIALGAVASVQVQLDSADVLIGSQLQLSVTARDAQGLVVTGRPVVWTTGNASVAAVSATGLVAALVEGSTFITADVDGVASSAMIFVLAELVPAASVTVWPESTRIAVDSTLQLWAWVRDAAGNTLSRRSVTWSSSDTAVATVAATASGGALIAGVAAGIAEISATVEGKSDTAVVAVGPPGSILQLILSSDRLTLVPQATQQLSVVGRDDQGFLNPIDVAQIVWTSSDISVAPVSATGLVSGVREGAATITAAWRGHEATASVTVLELSFDGISVAGWTTCGVTANGTAFCWGENGNGRLGSGIALDVSPYPMAVAGGHTFTEVRVGTYSTCGLADAGRAFCWGFGVGGFNVDTPAVVPGDLTFGRVAVGGDGDFACALAADGAAHCWGYFVPGFENGDTRIESPRAVPGGRSFIAISAGFAHVCALAADSVAYCWGGNRHGQLGTGDRVYSNIPRAVGGGLMRFAALSTGEYHTCGVDVNGAAFCWGSFTGVLDRYPSSATPTRFAAGVTFVTVSGNGQHSCGLDSGGTVHCWYEYDAGTWTDPSGLAFAKLSVGRSHACAVTPSGVGYCSGRNNAGQLGDGSFTDPFGWVKIAGQP
ncbi:MAG TPA: Ig-like domain-containing protein [Gemmatimonadales bacterium]|jgi:uncharacterized protein YjdB|nr:Ig-like domain-containing protein [Gemmatimonadales bacterium]